MQQQIHSYAFQLKQDSICSQVSSHPYQMLFYSSVNRRNDPNQSIIYKLAYTEDHPRKSHMSNANIKGRAHFVKPIAFGAETCQIFLNITTDQNYIKILPNDYFDQTQTDANGLNQFYANERPIKDIQKGKDSNLFVTMDNQIVMIDPNKPGSTESIITVEQGKRISHCAIDPARGYLTYCIDNNIFVYDKASKTQKYSFKVCPQAGDSITNIDFNPNKQYYLMTGHYDLMKFWDIRKSNIPVKTVEDHHSLLLKAIYNHAHDELILGCYDDGTVGLYRMSSVSSSPSGQGSDALVKLYDEHEDSVYHACWGHSPWVFASVSYSATNLVINIVPSVEKYRILL